MPVGWIGSSNSSSYVEEAEYRAAVSKQRVHSYWQVGEVETQLSVSVSAMEKKAERMS